VDIGVATVSDWKTGYCAVNVFASKEQCCLRRGPLLSFADTSENCAEWKVCSSNYYGAFGIYVDWALFFGILAGSVTMTTKRYLPAAAPGIGDKYQGVKQNQNTNGERAELDANPVGKSMYMVAGSGIPEIKTILSGFAIPHFPDFKVLLVKAIGATFVVSTGMCPGKEGPFVHISTCVAYKVAIRFSKYRDSGRKLREMLTAGCASGLSVAFGAPIGGVLFAYEEISTYFPRKVLWQAFICSLFAAIILRALNPTGTGQLVLFETNYETKYEPVHYLVFIILVIAGGLFGGIFCKENFL
jgi:chloride channel 3/4/5